MGAAVVAQWERCLKDLEAHTAKSFSQVNFAAATAVEQHVGMLLRSAAPLPEPIVQQLVVEHQVGSNCCYQYQHVVRRNPACPALKVCTLAASSQTVPQAATPLSSTLTYTRVMTNAKHISKHRELCAQLIVAAALHFNEALLVQFGTKV